MRVMIHCFKFTPKKGPEWMLVMCEKAIEKIFFPANDTKKMSKSFETLG
jgi:hypothetical protein